ncbi:LuxR family transcriptional regulator [Rhizobium sp. RM]|uniref:helix-turn-helix transcriptional regulator n=1 Tax=Rhizobium sp. RM TaxID=2748079 RepID=UPI00110DCF34|nr:LuxR family transcriptional regulator [Rhizobium sp. RM]NWJ26829.1 autoinducer binding domain-containing protein [Rhizobium sp. RM]TMV22702.1 LuxR family transcriptional regulator [Rhizobium sp. Td3]
MLTLGRQSNLSQQFSASANTGDWLAALTNLACEFGYAHVTLLKIPSTAGSGVSAVILETTLPQWIIREVGHHGPPNDCAAIRCGMSSLVPQYWSMDEDDALPGTIALTTDSFRGIGITCGLTIPLNGLNGGKHLLTFGGDRTHLPQAALNELGMICLHAFEIYDRLCRTGIKSPSPLTKRELDVVRWTAQGKTSVEIAEILSISEHTVNAYMNNAMRKLDCVNRTQLVAKTIRLKLIN